MKKVSSKIQLPILLKSLAISLEDLGIEDLAWKWEDIHHVIEFLTQNGFAILGGDVYIIKNNQKEATYDSWYIDKEPGKSWSDYVDECKKVTIDYINKYHAKNGDNYCYSLIYTNNQGN